LSLRFQEVAVAYYRLYFKVGGHISDVAEFICDDDESALERAAGLHDRRAMELWELSRPVASWEAQPNPSFGAPAQVSPCAQRSNSPLSSPPASTAITDSQAQSMKPTVAPRGP
jgi:hypothetical protein